MIEGRVVEGEKFRGGNGFVVGYEVGDYCLC